MKAYQQSKLIMYVQQLSRLPFENEEALIKRIKSLDYVEKYAEVLHDKDEGEAHVHVVFMLDKKTSIEKLAKDLNEPNQAQFEIMTKRGKSVKQSATNSFRYLIHRTKQAIEENKYQYDPHKVKANFDYPKFIDKTNSTMKKTKKREKSDDKKIEEILERFAKDEISYEKAVHDMRDIDVIKTANKMTFLSKIQESKNVDSNYQWKKEKHTKCVLWFYGATGTGKTTLAKHILKSKYDTKVYVTGGNRDLFQDYNNQHGILIDDFRANVMDYNEMLKMLDPYNLEVSVSSRYHNKEVQGELYIITCPYTPYKFYTQMGLCQDDAYGQLARRIDMIVHFEDDKVTVESIDVEISNNEYFSREKIKEEGSVDNLINKSIENFYHSTDKLLKEAFKKSKTSVSNVDEDCEIELKPTMTKHSDGTITFENCDTLSDSELSELKKTLLEIDLDEVFGND